PPNGHPTSAASVRHSLRIIGEPGEKFAPVTVTVCPFTRSTDGVTLIEGGGGIGPLGSKLIGATTTRVSTLLETVAAGEHAPGALAQSTSPSSSRRTRRTITDVEKVPSAATRAGGTGSGEPFTQSSYESASEVHCETW